MEYKILEEELLHTLDKSHNVITRKLITDIISSFHGPFSSIDLRRHEFGICYSDYGYYPPKTVREFANEIYELSKDVKDEDIKKIFLGLHDRYKPQKCILSHI